MDESFITGILQKGKDAKLKVQNEFSGISFQQLNWKPSRESWSIAQCLNHLIISGNSYFLVLNKITEGSYQMNFWEKYSPFSKILGRLMKGQLKEQVGRKMKAPGKFLPAQSSINIEILERYYKNLDEFLGLVSKCVNVDIDKTIITSPVVSIVTYSLRDALQLLVQHEHRHINQGIRVKINVNFPGH